MLLNSTFVRMRSLLFLISILFSTYLYSGVIDTIWNIPSSSSRHTQAEKIYKEQVQFMDSTKALFELETLRNIAIASEDHKLEVIALFSIGKYYRFQCENGAAKAINFLNKALRKSRKYKTNEYTREIIYTLGEALCHKGDYKNGFKYMLEGDRLMNEYGYQNIHRASRHLYHLAYAYFLFGNYNRAIHYLNLSIKHASADNYHQVRLGCYNLMAMTYGRLEKYDTALYFYEKALNDKYSDYTPRGMLLGNMGDLYLKQKLYKKARPLLEESYSLYLQEDKFSNHALAPLITIADLELCEKNFEKGLKRLNEFYILAKKHHEKRPESWAEYYKLSARYYVSVEDFKTAKIYQDSLISIQNDIDIKKDANMLTNLEVQMVTERHLSAIALMEKEKSRQSIIFNATWIISCLTIIILLGTFYIIRLRQKRKQHELESERKRAEEQVENYRSRLKFFVEGIRKKNELIEVLKEQVEDTPLYGEDHYIPTYTENRKIIDQLHESVILTKEDWLNFKKLFEKSHPGFVFKLRMEYPNLTVAEIRFLMLIKLNLSAPEMANMLGISSDSVSRTSQRLRKKIGLSSPIDLLKLVEEIGD